MNTKRLAWVYLFGAVLSVLSCADADDGKSSALVLEGRLIAPCCWTQTLDVHESELAADLRDEIRDRLARGERADDIEDDLVARYGERIRAVPKGRDPRISMALVTVAGIALAGLGLVGLLRRWTARARRDAASGAAQATEGPRDVYDDRLDAELADMDDTP